MANEVAIGFTSWVQQLFESQRDEITVLALYRHVYQLEHQFMAQVEELQTQINELTADIAAERAEVSAKVQELLDKITDLEAAVAQGTDLTAAIEAIKTARTEVQSIITVEPAPVEPELPVVDPTAPVDPPVI